MNRLGFYHTMNFKTGIKFILIFTAFIFTLAAAGNFAAASDYQYKILDPKYNPSAEKLVEGNLPPVEEVEFDETQKGFDFGRFFAIIAAIVFPAFVISLAFKTYKKVMEEVPGRENIIEDSSAKEKEKKEETISNIKIPSQPDTVIEKAQEKEEHKPEIQPHKPLKKPAVSNNTIEKALQKEQKTTGYATSPVVKKNPMLLNTLHLTRNKGFCLVEYNNKYSLIGYINNEIFLLNQFDNINSVEIRSRLSETIDNKDRYIVRLGGYKALIEVSDSDMNLLVNL